MELENRRVQRLPRLTRALASKRSRGNNWIKYSMTILPSVIFGIFTIIFSLQQSASNKLFREQDQNQAMEQVQRSIFDNYIDVISERLLSPYFHRSIRDHILSTRVKTLTTLRYLDSNHKRESFFFYMKINFLSHPPHQSNVSIWMVLI